jgi:CDP-diacylglycerol--serine O-phosphatidyltransferase
MFLGLYNYTVFLTYINVLSGFLGISFAVQKHDFVNASIFLLISGICDIFDGFVSKLKKKRSDKEKKYGIQIDSLADMVSFGILPTLIGWSFIQKEYMHDNKFIFFFFDSLDSFQIFFLFCCGFYVLSALIRLAYFNILQEIKKDSNSNNFIGLPVTFSSIIFPLIILIQKISQQNVNKNNNISFFYFYEKFGPIIYLFFIILLSFLFIFDKIKFKKKKSIYFLMFLSFILITLIFNLLFINQKRFDF